MRNTGALRAAVLCSTAFVLLASFSGTAAAEPVVQSPADQLPRELVEAVQRDLKISPQEYLDRAARAQELSAYASDFRASRPADFAGAWIGPDGNAVVAVTSPAAAQAVAKDGYATAQSPVSADGLEKSLADLNSWIAGLPREISEQINGTAIDFIDNQIVIDLVNSPIGSALNLPTLLANIKVILSPGGNKPVDPTPMGGDTYVTTSGPIADAPATDISICSFGFNAVDPSESPVDPTAAAHPIATRPTWRWRSTAAPQAWAFPSIRSRARPEPHCAPSSGYFGRRSPPIVVQQGERHHIFGCPGERFLCVAVRFGCRSLQFRFW
jgi:hypothetical protein